MYEKGGKFRYIVCLPNEVPIWMCMSEQDAKNAIKDENKFNGRCVGFIDLEHWDCDME